MAVFQHTAEYKEKEMEHFVYDKSGKGLSHEEIKEALLVSLEGKELNNVLIIPPDFTRFHSNAGFITNVYYDQRRK